MNGGQLGRICRAIDELAASSAAGAGDATGGTAPATRDRGTAGAGAAREGGSAGAEARAAREGGTDGADGAETARPAGREDADIARLAAIWEMVADADPELAKRLPGYLSATE